MKRGRGYQAERVSSIQEKDPGSEGPFDHRD